MNSNFLFFFILFFNKGAKKLFAFQKIHKDTGISEATIDRLGIIDFIKSRRNLWFEHARPSEPFSIDHKMRFVCCYQRAHSLTDLLARLLRKLIMHFIFFLQFSVEKKRLRFNSCVISLLGLHNFESFKKNNIKNPRERDNSRKGSLILYFCSNNELLSLETRNPAVRLLLWNTFNSIICLSLYV